MNRMERYYPESRFGGFTDIDGTVVFFNRVNALLTPSSVVLDVGCGRGACDEDSVALRKNLSILKGKVAKVVGIDVDPRAQENPYIDEFHCLAGDIWPIDSNAIDLIVCDNVLEHIADTDRFFAEARRVLKNGGYLCIRTPNRWGYVALAARLIPNRYHTKALSFVQVGRKEIDIFPTLYKCNSIGKIGKILKKNDFDCVVYGYEAEPSYLGFSWITYFFGVLHQRLACGFFKPAIFAFGRIQK